MKAVRPLRAVPLVVLACAFPAPALAGTAGNSLTGGAGNDVLVGDDEAGDPGSGNDTMDGGIGADTLRGGDGIDTAGYAHRASAVTVTLDDVAGDGQAGEHDNVRSDVENVVGGAGGDAITGSATRNVLVGGNVAALVSA